jgi:hypothetical protein
MSIKTKNTEKSVSKIVRSHLSQQFENAKSGVYEEGIDETKLEEPSVLISLPKKDPTIPPGNQGSSDIKQLMSLSLSRETIEDLKKMIRVRNVENKLDAWIGSSLLKELDSVEEFESLKEERADYIKDVISSYDQRQILIDKIQDFISRTSSSNVMNDPMPWKLLLRGNISSSSEIEEIRLPALYSNRFLEKFYDAHQSVVEDGIVDEKRVSLQTQINPNVTFGEILDNLSSANRFLRMIGPIGAKVIPTRAYTSAMVKRCIHWASSCVDRGISPQFALDPQGGAIFSDHPAHGVAVPVVDALPKLVDIGYHKLGNVSINSLVDITSQTSQALSKTDESVNLFTDQASRVRIIGDEGPENIIPALDIPSPISVPIPIPAEDPSQPNLIPGNPLNPGVRVKSYWDTFFEDISIKQNLAVNIKDLATTFTIMGLESEIKQSQGMARFLNSDNRFVNNVNNRSPGEGLGEAVLGEVSNKSKSTFSKSNIGNDASEKAESVIRLRTQNQDFENAGNDISSKDLLIYEKALSIQDDISETFHSNSKKIKDDLYTVLLSKVLDPDSEEKLRELSIKEMHSVYRQGQDILHDAVGFVAATENINSVAGNTQAMVSGYHTGKSLNSKNIFAKVSCEVPIQLTLKFNENNAEVGHPYLYWDVGNQPGIQNDKTLIAQASALIMSSARRPGAYPGINSPSTNLRSQIVKAVIARDLFRAQYHIAAISDPHQHNRIIGYHPKVIQRQQAINFTSGKAGFYNYGSNKADTFSALVKLGFFENTLPAHFFTQVGQGHNNNNTFTSISEAVTIAFANSTDDYLPESIKESMLPEEWVELQNRWIQLDPETAIKENAAHMWLRQGSIDTSYRVTKFGAIPRVIDAINGYKSEVEIDNNKTDLYDMIIDFVDYLEQEMKELPGVIGASLTDNSFNQTVQEKVLGKHNTYFHPAAGLTNANKFDRSILISTAVELFSNSLEDMFEVRGGLQSAIPSNGFNQNNLTGQQLSQYLSPPFVCEIISKSITHTMVLERNRLVDYSTQDAFVHTGHTMYIGAAALERKTYSWSKLNRILSQTYAVLNSLTESPSSIKMKKENIKNAEQLACLMIRSSVLHSKWYKENAISIGEVTTAPVKYVIQTATTLDNPFGDFPKPAGEAWSPSVEVPHWYDIFRKDLRFTLINNLHAPDWFVNKSKAAIFMSQSANAGIQAILNAYDIHSKYLIPAEQLQEDYNAFKENIDKIDGDRQSNIPFPVDVSKAQIMKRKEAALQLMYRIKKPTHSTTGFISKEGLQSRYLMTVLGSFLDSFLADMVANEEGEKKLIFYGLGPNAFYESLLKTSENVNSTGQRPISPSNQSTYDHDLGIRLSLEADRSHPVEPGIVFKSLSLGEYEIEGIIFDADIEKLAQTAFRLDTPINYNQLVDKAYFVKTLSTSEDLTPNRFYTDMGNENKDSVDSLSTHQPDLEGNQAGIDVVHKLFKQKVDTYCMLKIIEIVTGMSLSESTLGNKNNYRYFNVTAVDTVFSLLSSNDNSVINFDNIKDLLVKETVTFLGITPEGTINRKVEVYRMRDYDDELKRDLRPHLERKELEPLATLVNPKINNEELIMADVIFRSSIFQDALTLDQLMNDQILMVEIPENKDISSIIDLENTSDVYKDPITGKILEEFEDYVKDVSLQVIQPKATIKIGKIWNV